MESHKAKLERIKWKKLKILLLILYVILGLVFQVLTSPIITPFLLAFAFLDLPDGLPKILLFLIFLVGYGLYITILLSLVHWLIFKLFNLETKIKFKLSDLMIAGFGLIIVNILFIFKLL